MAKSISGGYKLITAQELDVNSSTQLEDLGTRVMDNEGNEYIYLEGVASTAVGNWVTYDEDYATALLTADAVGPVAIAMAATVANEFGWYQIFGVNTAAVTDTTAADKALYIDGTDGRADDAAVAGDLIIGAVSRTADSSNVTTVYISYPYVADSGYLT